MDSPLVLTVFTEVVEEANALDAVTGETIAGTDEMWYSSPSFYFFGGSRGNFQRCTSLPVLQPSGDKSTVPGVPSSHRIY